MAAVVPTARATFDLVEADGTTVVRSLGTAFERTWQDQMDGAGSGSCSFPLEAAADWSAITPGRLVRCSLDGTARFTFAPRTRTVRAVTRSDRVVDVEGPGLLGILDDAVVLARPGTESFAGSLDRRLFGWQCPEFDDSGWSAQAIGAGISDPVCPEFWPSPGTTNRVWISGAGAGSSVAARRNFTTSATKAIAIFITASGGARVWLDGVPIGETDQPPNTSEEHTWRWVPQVPSGSHTLAIESDSASSGTPWFACIAYAVDDPRTGELNTSTFLFQTGNLPGGGGPEPWKLYRLDGQPRPGLTWGQILGKLLTEAQTRGRLTGWTKSFSDSTDSLGAAWGATPDYIVDIGRPLSELVEPGSQSEADHWASATGLTLHAAGWRTRGNFDSSPPSPPKLVGGYYATSDPRAANLSELVHTTDLRPAAVTVWARHRDGFTATGTGPERYADFGDLPTATAAKLSTDMIASRGDEEDTFTAAVVPVNGDERPYVDVGMGDTLSVPTGALGAEVWQSSRVVGITVSPSEASHHDVSITLELSSQLAETQAVMARSIARTRAGAVTASISAPVELGTGVKGGRLEGWKMLFSKDGLLGAGATESQRYPFPAERARPTRFVQTLRQVDSAAVTWQFKKNGVAVHTGTMPAATNANEGNMGSIVGQWPDIGTVEFTDTGDDIAEGFALVIDCAPAV